MKPRISLLLMVSILLANNVFSQNLEEHQWEHRLILVIAEDKANEKFKAQIKLLEADIAGLADRKIMVYKINPDAYAKGIDSNHWINSEKLHEEYSNDAKDFEVILIGLDGGIKLRQSEILQSQKLYAIIDRMPMRRAEIRRSGKN